MNPLLLAPILEIGKSLIDRFIPDPAEKAKAELEMLRSVQDGDLKQAMLQLEINAKEAQSPSLFVSGGRPFFIWISGVGFGYVTLIQPILVWVAKIKGWPEPPEPNIDLLWVVASGLLGLGSLRTVEKVKKVASK